MLPIYQANSIEQIALIGGSTQPCIMGVIDESGRLCGNYVVKVFKHKNREGTNQEVYGNVLAQHFDLSVPMAAFVHVPQDMIDVLKKERQYEHFDLREGTYFATKYLENSFNFTPALSISKLEDWEMSKIFAFDMLIRNVDRTEHKPNLFFHQHRTTLIDHELSLELQHPFLFYVERDLYKAIAQGAKGNHLFFNVLRQKMKKNEVDFSEFTEYL